MLGTVADVHSLEHLCYACLTLRCTDVEIFERKLNILIYIEFVDEVEALEYESDVSLASASNAIIIGFNVKIDPMSKATAEREGVDVRLYRVIYQAIEDVEAAMKGMLDPEYEEKVIGSAEVRQLFRVSKVGTIAGA